MWLAKKFLFLPFLNKKRLNVMVILKSSTNNVIAFITAGTTLQELHII